MELGKKIKELRTQKGLTQNELAEKLYVSYQAVSQWENGTTNPDINTIIELAKEFDLSLDDLFDLKKSNSQEEQINIKDAKEDELYILVAKGNTLKQLIDYKEYIKHHDNIKIEYDGSLNSVYSQFSITVKGDVSGEVIAGDSVVCGNVEGDVNAGDNVTCAHVNGDINAGDKVTCANVIGDVNAGDVVDCKNITGNVNSDVVEAEEINGVVDANDIKITKKKSEK